MRSPLGHHWPFVDLEVYRLGGHAILNGAHLYELLFPGALAFTYPPLSAMAFTLLAPLRLALLAAAGALWLEPMWSTLHYGQIDLLIAALVLYDLSRPDASRWKGAPIGLATGLKLTPAIFAVYLLLSRRYRAAAV